MKALLLLLPNLAVLLGRLLRDPGAEDRQAVGLLPFCSHDTRK